MRSSPTDPLSLVRGRGGDGRNAFIHIVNLESGDVSGPPSGLGGVAVCLP